FTCDKDFLKFVNARDTGLKIDLVRKDFEAIWLATNFDRHNHNFLLDLIDWLVSGLSIEQIAKRPEITIRAKKQRKKIKRGLLQLDEMIASETFNGFIEEIDKESDKEKSDVTKKRFFYYKGFIFCDLSDIKNDADELKYGISLPYYILEPELRRRGWDFKFLLTCRGNDRTGNLHYTFSINQSRSDLVSNINLNEFATAKGGGGHTFISGFVTEPESFLDTIKDAFEFAKDYVERNQ
ncbi:MAG: hypothetical protein ACTSRA_01590, partial [Promethearchaeota archaeon]